MKIQIYSDTRDEWRWRLVASNGEIIADSAEGYNNLTDLDDMLDELWGDRIEREYE